jgi:hypothetical protein
VFDDFNDATRHESACQLKKRLELLDRKRTSNARPATKNSPFHTSRAEIRSPDISISSTTDAFEGEIVDESRRTFMNVPRVIEFQKSTGLLQNPSLDYQDSPIKYKESFATLSTTRIQQGFATPFCSTTYSGIPNLPKIHSRKQEFMQQPSQRYQQSLHTQTYLPPSYKGVHHDGSSSEYRRNHPTTYDSPSSPDITLNKLDFRDDSSGRFLTHIPNVRDVQVIASRDDSSQAVSSREQEEQYDSFEQRDDLDNMGKTTSMKWVCDVCKEAQFENYVEAFRHEMQCRKKFYLEQRQEQYLRDLETLAQSEPDRFYAEQRAQRRENLKRQWYEKSRTLVSKMDSIHGGSAPAETPVVAKPKGRDTRSRSSDGNQKWLCSICKQKYFEHYLDACRHEKECVMKMHPPQEQQRLQPLPRPKLRYRREKYA